MLNLVADLLFGVRFHWAFWSKSGSTLRTWKGRAPVTTVMCRVEGQF